MHGHQVAVVDVFVYLGALTHSSVLSSYGIHRRSGLTRSAMQKISDNCIWKSRLSLSTKLKLYNVCILPIMLYGSERWVSKADARKVGALDQWCLRRILDIRWYHRVFNCEVRRLTEQPLLTTIIQKRKLMLFFGHLVRMGNERSSFANASFFLWSLERLDTPINVVQSQWRYSTVRKGFYFLLLYHCKKIVANRYRVM